MFNKKLDNLLMVLSIIISIISLFYLPDSIPASYDQFGNVTRYGSKYEIALLFPVVMISIYLVINFIEYTLLAIHLRYITKSFKRFVVLVFSFENIKNILKVFNINIHSYISALLWIIMIIISCEYKIKKK